MQTATVKSHMITGQALLENADWYKALSLRERIALLRTASCQADQETTNKVGAEQRLERWRAQPPFNNQSVFAERLASDGTNEPELLHILGESIYVVRDRSTTPRWLADISQAFSASTPVQQLPFPKSEGGELFDLLYLIEPLLHRAMCRVREGAQELARRLAKSPIDPHTVAELVFPGLAKRLLGMVSRTAALELNVARLEGVLEGVTPEERFRSFVRRLSQRENGLAILLEYPVLARELTNCIDLWSAFSLELFEHLCAEWQQILQTFSPSTDLGVLVEVEETGDQHKQGRCVLILKFSSGLRLVYKPRSMSLDVHFQNLLSWINGYGKEPEFRTLKILDCGNHGWVEFVVTSPCVSQEEVRRFYRRQGGYLALLYALQAVDFHSENVIAAGEHPLLIDVEALFHSTPDDMLAAENEDPPSYVLASSVLRIGLLPQRIWGDTEGEGIDISGLGGKGGQLTPFGVPRWEKAATDEMQFTRKRIPIEACQNRPSLASVEVDLLEYAEEITTGFADIYRFLIRHRDQLLSSDGPLASFGNDEVRVILRATRTYAVLLGESFHPDVLRNALDREQLFDRLWVAVEEQPYLANAILAERNDLQNADIPIFTAQVNSRDLLTSSHARIANIFPESGLELCHRQLRLLSEQDLDRQLWFIRSSLATLAPDPEQVRESPHPTAEANARPARDQLLSAACAIGDRLADLALRGPKNVNWVGLIREESQQWSVLPLGLDLYDGLPGVALYLGYLGAITADEEYTALARAACATFESEVERNRASISWIGGFAGWGGIIYALTHLGTLWNDRTLLKSAVEFVKHLPPLIDQDEKLDIHAGAAGCIAGLLALYQCCPSTLIHNAAVQAGKHLVARAQTMDRGVAWVVRADGPKPLFGFARGAAGIAWALLRLAASTGEERFQSVALAAIEYERTMFSAEAAGWRGLHDFIPGATKQVENQFPTSWCRGTAGIGLARLGSLEWVDIPEVRLEINEDLTITLARGFGSNHSLCHGDLGNIELLLHARVLLDRSYWNVQVQQAASSILEDIREHGWLCGTPTTVESPGLMTGLAGIGYGLLRLAEPLRVPPILLLMPPVPSSQQQ